MPRKPEISADSLRKLLAAGGASSPGGGSSSAASGSGSGPWSPKLSPTQQLVFDDQSLYILMHGNRGGGKCVAKGTFVPLARTGLVQMGGESLGVPGKGLPGSSREMERDVYTMESPGGEPSWEKTGVYYCDGAKPGYVLRTTFGYRFVGSAEHPVYVRDRVSGSEGYSSLADLAAMAEEDPRSFDRIEARMQAGALVDERCRFPAAAGEPRTLRRAEVETPLTPDTAWMLGYLFFGGARSPSGKRALQLPAKEKAFSAKFRRVFYETFGMDLVSADQPRKNRHGFEFDGFFLTRSWRLGRLSPELNRRIDPVHRFLEALGVFWFRDETEAGRSWEEIPLPPEILESDRETLGAFLVGAIESTRTKEVFYSSHPDLARGEEGSDGAFNADQFARFAGGSRKWKVVFSFAGARERHTLQQLLLALGVRTFEPVSPSVGKKEGGIGRRTARLVVHPDDMAAFYGLGGWNRGSEREFHGKMKSHRAKGKYDPAPFAGVFWAPVHFVRPTGRDSEMFDLHVPAKECYVANGVTVHNTFVAMHKMVRHCWEEFNALGLVIVGVRSQATQGGAWDKLQLEVLPDWKQGIGLESTDPRMDEQHYKFIHVRNRHGGWSKIVLMSMPVGYDVTGRIRGFEPSQVFVDELTTLRDPAFFDAVVQQLGRRPGIRGPQQYLAATNPDGPSHWVYHRFFEIPLELTLDADTGKVLSAEGEWDDRYSTYLLQMEENKENLSKQYIQQVYEGVRRDPYARKRLLEGIWVDRPVGDGVFVDYYREEVHVVRNRGKRRLTPNPEFSCVIGYDLGKSCNSISFLQPVYVASREAFAWLLFDEMVYIHRRVPYRLLVNELYRRMDRWNKAAGKPLNWHHVSDDQAFNQYNPTAGTFDHFELQRISGDIHPRYDELGPLVMKPAPKFDGSVEARVRLTMDLLTDERLLVAEPCRKHRDMFQQLRTKSLKSGEYDPAAMYKPKRSVHLHPFDSLSYPILHASLKSPDYARPPGSGKKVQFMDVRLT